MIKVEHNSWMCFMTQKEPNYCQQILLSEVQVYNFDHQCNEQEKNVEADALLSLMEDSLDWEIHLVAKQSKGILVH